jgi:hypothetical protein
VKDSTGAEKVDLVGHSMGGLLARAYVQDSSYNSDVARLVTLGSPHYGVAKVYPFWQAAHVYDSDRLEKIGYEIAATLLMVKAWNPVPVLALREIIPSGQDLLPMWDYLYDDHTDLSKSESQMRHRNAFLAGLNNNVDILFQRLGDGNVASFAGQGISTGERFYVHPFEWWGKDPWNWFFEYFNWEDGEPDWSRQPEFRINAGDKTILASSARLPSPAYYAEFLNVDHARLPGDWRVIDEIFRFLGISTVTATSPQPVGQALIFYVNGPVHATVTNPQGKTVSAATPPKTSSQEASETLSGPFIPGAEYLTVTGDTFTYILIPDPVEGQYQIEVEGFDSGTYSLGLLDTFGPSEELITDLLAEWDTAQSQIEPSKKVTFTFDFSGHTNNEVLVAETPMIEVPVWANHTAIHGRALPGISVEIRDAADDLLLGSGQAGADGAFEISLSPRLELDQKIYPAAGGVSGVPVDVQPLKVFLPVMER